MDDPTNHPVPADPWSRPAATEPQAPSEPPSGLDPVTGRPTWPPRDPVTGRPLTDEPPAATGGPAVATGGPPVEPLDAPGRGPWTPSATPIPTPPDGSRGRKRTGRRAALITGIAILAGLTLKIGTGLLVTGVAGSALGTMFGGPYQRLPSEYRQEIESRMRTAVPGIDKMPSAEVGTRITALVSDGLLRLDDASTVTYWSAIGTALNRADTPRCAAVARESIGGGSTSPGSVASKLPETLDVPTLESLLTVTVSAIEASSRQSPDRRTVDEAVARPLINRFAAGLTPSEIGDLGQLDSGSLPEDRACASARAVFRAVGTLGPRDQATLVRYLLSN
jgi:hypothetical protein